MKLRLLYLLGLILILIAFTNCTDSGTGVNQNLERRKVTLIAPNTGSMQSVSPTFHWKAGEKVDSFYFKLSGSKDFSSTIISSIVDSVGLDVQDLPIDSTLYWKVRPVTESSETAWSDVWNFTVTKPDSGSPKLPSPGLLSPGDEVVDVSQKPTFKWKEVEGADAYLLHMSTSDKMVIAKQVNNTTFTPKDKLTAGVTFYWRIRALNNGNKGKWSDVISFTTKSITPAVTLVSPKDGAEVSKTSVLLKWKKLQGINKYRVQVAWEDYFSNPVINKTVEKNSYQVSGLEKGRTYYWRVQAVNDGNTENWSATHHFTIKAQDSPDGSDRSALMALYRATNGDNWIKNSGWGSNDPMGTWYGIETNAQGQVTKIDLWHNNLTDKIENVPWGKLDKVKYLNLKYNHLSGKIPPEIGNMTSLRVLILQGRTYGNNPAEFKEPPALDTGNWSLAYHQGKYYSNTNDFHGQIPDSFGNLSNLIVLEISNAPHVVGPIPPELGNLTNLKGLYLAQNNFSGTEIPEELCNLTNLKQLHLGQSGLVGNIPSCFSNLTELIILLIPGGVEDSAPFQAGGLTGSLPDFHNFTNIERIGLNKNNLTGQFPQYINNGNFTQLNALVLGWNDLTGTLPGFDNLQNLIYFGIAGNKMTGSIETLTELPAEIKIISVGWNNFSGDFPQNGWPDFYQLKTIYMNMGDTGLTGDIPCSFWKKLDNPELTIARFNSNNFDDVCIEGARAMTGDEDLELKL